MALDDEIIEIKTFQVMIAQSNVTGQQTIDKQKMNKIKCGP